MTISKEANSQTGVQPLPRARRGRTERITADRARRIALYCQRLDGSTRPSAGGEGAVETIEGLGYVQIDTIAVVHRAHEHTLWSRQSDYDPRMLHQLLTEERRVFEYWTHAASYVPMTDYSYYVRRMRALASGGRTRDWMKENRRTVAQVRKRIREEGPLMASNFEDKASRRGSWWGWKPAKRALECLFDTGELMIGERHNFQRVYDLTERVLPDGVDTAPPRPAEQARWAVSRALRNLGVATVADMRSWHGDRQMLTAAAADLVGSGEVTTVSVQGWESEGYALTQALEATHRRSRRKPALHILSPFDNLVIRRGQLERLFGFEYTIECYTPAAKRRYGYFCLPLLWGQRFVGRLDAKAERKERVLALKKLVFEPELADWDELLRALAAKLKQFARFNGCDEIRVEAVLPRKMTSPLKRALR